MKSPELTFETQLLAIAVIASLFAIKASIFEGQELIRPVSTSASVYFFSLAKRSGEIG